MELLLNGGQQLKPIFRRIVFHVLEEEPVDHGEGEFLECFNLREIHQNII